MTVIIRLIASDKKEFEIDGDKLRNVSFLSDLMYLNTNNKNTNDADNNKREENDEDFGENAIYLKNINSLLLEQLVIWLEHESNTEKLGAYDKLTEWEDSYFVNFMQIYPYIYVDMFEITDFMIMDSLFTRLAQYMAREFSQSKSLSEINQLFNITEYYPQYAESIERMIESKKDIFKYCDIIHNDLKYNNIITNNSESIDEK